MSSETFAGGSSTFVFAVRLVLVLFQFPTLVGSVNNGNGNRNGGHPKKHPLDVVSVACARTHSDNVACNLFLTICMCVNFE